MHVVISGASGLIGAALVEGLRHDDHEVTKLVRSQDQVGDHARFWSPSDGVLSPDALVGADAVVHLAGEPLTNGRWTDAKKKRIRTSRVDSTTLIARTVAAIPQGPRVLACASAVGFYGDRGADRLTESAPAGSGFLAGVCRDWEQAADPARQAGVRVVHLRFGIALSTDGGALASLLTPFKLGLGGPLGSGDQYMSWVALADVVAAVVHVLIKAQVTGPVNVVSPNPVTNREFARTLGAVLNRPAVVPVPAIAARLALGEMADEALLASQRAIPEKLVQSGFRHRYPELHAALEAALDD